MKLLTVIISVLLLSGCVTTVPVARKFPDAPQTLKQKCEELRTVETKEKVLITDVLKTVVQNYALYYECSIKVDGWIEWHNEQKKIFDQVK